MDEIGDVSPKMQVKLLRALQEKEIMPVGSMEPIHVDVRIICATNKPLEKMVEEGEFREDLYYRLNVFPIKIPPLRERKDDIEASSTYLLNQYNEMYKRNVASFTDDAIRELQRNDWPGNVRELENIISRTLINMTERDTQITGEDIRASINDDTNYFRLRKMGQQDTAVIVREYPDRLSEALEQVERECIEKALAEFDGDKNKAAVKLDIPLRTLYYKCKKLGI